MSGNKVFTFDTQTYLSHPLKEQLHTYVVIEGTLEDIKYDHEAVTNFIYDEAVGLLKDDVHTLTFSY